MRPGQTAVQVAATIKIKERNETSHGFDQMVLVIVTSCCSSLLIVPACINGYDVASCDFIKRSTSSIVLLKAFFSRFANIPQNIFFWAVKMPPFLFFQ
jgi:hypothetical protein